MFGAKHFSHMASFRIIRRQEQLAMDKSAKHKGKLRQGTNPLWLGLVFMAESWSPLRVVCRETGIRPRVKVCAHLPLNLLQSPPPAGNKKQQKVAVNETRS